MSTHRIKSPIVGTQYYPGALAALAEIPDGSDVVLRREPGNPYDQNAIAVYNGMAILDAQQLGHIIANVAKVLAPIMDARHEPEMLATFHCNNGKPRVSVVIERT